MADVPSTQKCVRIQMIWAGKTDIFIPSLERIGGVAGGITLHRPSAKKKKDILKGLIIEERNILYNVKREREKLFDAFDSDPAHHD